MASPNASEVKSIITGLLTSNPLRSTVAQLCCDFVEIVGYKIPFQSLGFNSVEDYLRSIPDTVQVRIYNSYFGYNTDIQTDIINAHIGKNWPTRLQVELG
jgi:hypothetical protein